MWVNLEIIPQGTELSKIRPPPKDKCHTTPLTEGHKTPLTEGPPRAVPLRDRKEKAGVQGLGEGRGRSRRWVTPEFRLEDERVLDMDGGDHPVTTGGR